MPSSIIASNKVLKFNLLSEADERLRSRLQNPIGGGVYSVPGCPAQINRRQFAAMFCRVFTETKDVFFACASTLLSALQLVQRPTRKA